MKGDKKMCKKMNLISKELQDILPKDASVIVDIHIPSENENDESAEITAVVEELRKHWDVDYYDHYDSTACINVRYHVPS